ncbi:hypothetical protein SUVZ_09G1830 [Saccharomyces uvarum]|uniref:protein-tyrosine-phosphatase n=1 Tax=Saccharomyces uvarum TaxID=230603 RepID=A0ABN8WY94_SACUV|nr:hypothetical protein SUVZ_09G1830 [Saccharomyces uvarum]
MAENTVPIEEEVVRILGGIYLGGIRPIVDHRPLGAEFNITHILSAIRFQVIPEYLIRKGYTLKNIPIDDDDVTDVLQYFDETNRFIDQCLFPNEIEYSPKLVDFKKKPQRGAVFAHCQAGISRSVTFVVAYLMYRYGLTLSMAMHAVKRKKANVEPNENFMEQLELFEHMGGDFVDFDNPAYKQWKLKQSIKLDPSGNELVSNADMFKDSESSQDLDKLTEAEKSKVTAVRCKNCRTKLALSTSFIAHDPPSKESSEGHFIKRAANSHRIIDIQESQANCSHFFIEPLKWMQPELQGKQELEGKFSCPGCSRKVGGYNWKGSRCSCGKWVIPAIHLQTSKVDQFPLQSTVLPNMVNFESEKKIK